MNHRKHSIIAIIIFSLYSCNSVNEAQKIANSFFTAFNNKNTTIIDTLLDKESVIDAGLKNEFYDVFNQHWKTFGKVNSYSRLGFTTNTNNSISIVKLNFNCETEKGATIYEKLSLIKRNKGYKIIAFKYNIDRTKIEEEY